MPEFETIGKYEVLDIIGEGGFGVVYKARDPLMQRLVAIKVCSTEDEQVRKRFLREARIAGGLDHPNIVTAYDFGTENDVPYLVQELLSGEDLRIRIDRHDSIEATTKLHYLAQIAKGLQYAHGRNVLHRDIKPANVRVLDDDRVKLMDFGMAKITKESGTRLTQDGSVMGTAGYFAPEQLKALELDQRVDIFSFGVLAYELLTYRKAFPGETFMVVFRQVLQEEPEPIRSTWPDCPEQLSALIDKCLQKERENRFTSFDELLPILYSILSSDAFDRRAHQRQSAPSEVAAKPTVVAATVLKPSSDLQPPAAKPSSPAPPQPTPPTAKPTEPVLAPAAKIPAAASDHKVQDRSRSKPVPATPSTSLFASKRTWIVAGAAILLLAVVVFWLASGKPESQESAVLTPETETVEPSETETTTPPVPTFPVVVAAQPWGEIREIRTDGGEVVALPSRPYTPIVLQLEEGAYTITVEDPGSGDLVTCEVQVPEPSISTPCEFAFQTIDAIEYFKESGWWE